MTGKYDVNKAMELLFNNEFGLTDGEIRKKRAKTFTATE